MLFDKNTSTWKTKSGFDLEGLDPLHKVAILEAETPEACATTVVAQRTTSHIASSGAADEKGKETMTKPGAIEMLPAQLFFEGPSVPEPEIKCGAAKLCAAQKEEEAAVEGGAIMALLGGNQMEAVDVASKVLENLVIYATPGTKFPGLEGAIAAGDADAGKKPGLISLTQLIECFEIRCTKMNVPTPRITQWNKDQKYLYCKLTGTIKEVAGWRAVALSLFPDIVLGNHAFNYDKQANAVVAVPKHDPRAGVVGKVASLFGTQTWTVQSLRSVRDHAGVHFYYDFYPVAVEYWEESRGFLETITSLCAIIGGIFVISSIVDGCAHSSIRSLSGKAH